ncbi:uncharacterized protein LOC143286436 [Babylonia areolata]|uniref:uncharacterized protein LOC143286436 n=1 Tax=Babylonia areolata TaxID=304850 RepID=UPI003FD3589B
MSNTNTNTNSNSNSNSNGVSTAGPSAGPPSSAGVRPPAADNYCTIDELPTTATTATTTTNTTTASASASSGAVSEGDYSIIDDISTPSTSAAAPNFSKSGRVVFAERAKAKPDPASRRLIAGNQEFSMLKHRYEPTSGKEDYNTLSLLHHTTMDQRPKEPPRGQGDNCCTTISTVWGRARFLSDTSLKRCSKKATAHCPSTQD